MSLLAKKIATAKRIMRDHGWPGVGDALSKRIRIQRVTKPPLDYARLLPSVAGILLKYGRPEVFINAIGAGIGDDLMCTVVLRELRERKVKRVWITTRHPSLFRHNTDVLAVVPPHDRFDILLKHAGARVVYPWYTSYNPAFDRDDPMPEQHIIAVMCQKAGISGTVTLKPHMVLTHGEMQRGRVATRQIAIQSSGLSAKHSMMNKNWATSGYQEVVDRLKGDYSFVQLGSTTDPPLTGVLDLRGQTDLRETAAILASSITFVGQVGLLMHMARAVDCRSVIVYGGRETPSQSGYSCNENLQTVLPCSPCWKLNACSIDRACLTLITSEDVVASTRMQIERYRAPLEVDHHTITNEQIERNVIRHEAAVRAHQSAWVALYK